VNVRDAHSARVLEKIVPGLLAIDDPAINIVPPDPYYPPDPFLPPDPYRVARNPPSDLPAYQSGAMILSFTAPRAAGPSSGTIVIGYQDAAGASYTLRVPVQGTSY